MTITKQIYWGSYMAPEGGNAWPFEVTCRLVQSQSGLESLHIQGWIGQDGARNPLSKLGITMPGETMRGKERSIAMAHIAESVRGHAGR
jgi:hypothetical protein